MPECNCGEWLRDGAHLRDHLIQEHPAEMWRRGGQR